MPRPPKRAPKAEALPTTLDEFLEQGSMDEESGDRWLGGDMAKALRFYQKAYTSYIKAISLGSLIDSYYNSLRLLLLVHEDFIKAEGVQLDELKNIGEVLTNDDRSVVQPLDRIQLAHETALSIARPLDLLHNMVVVYTEVIENSDASYAEDELVASRGIAVLQELAERQVAELTAFCKELADANNEENSQTGSREVNSQTGSQSENPSENLETGPSSKLDADVIETVQPTDVFETAITAYKLAQALLESTAGNPSDLARAQNLVEPILAGMDALANGAVNDLPDTVKGMLDGVTEQQHEELVLLRASVRGLVMNDLGELLDMWNSVPESSARNMTAADSLQAFMERGDLSSEQRWKCLTAMNTFLKQAQAGLQAQQKGIPMGGLGLGALVAQISGVYVMRADIEVQRSQVAGYEEHRDMLVGNAKTMLKNAMTVAKTSGGLRERMAERLQREKKKVDAVMRMCLLERKLVVEIDAIMGRERWVRELPAVRELGFYDLGELEMV